MSVAEEEKPKRQSNRRRRPQGGKRNKSENTPSKDATATVVPEKIVAPKRERSPLVPPPSESFGQRVIGVVNTVIRKGKLNFGFLTIGSAEATVDESTPRIYFNPSCVAEEGKVILRRGYTVEFTVEKDEQSRAIAKDIKLTPEGAKTRDEREAAIAERRAERQQVQKEEKVSTEIKTEENKEGRGKPKRVRQRKEGRKITLNAKAEGCSEEKTVEINVNQNIGKLKVMASKELGITAETSVYFNGEFLTKAILRKLNDNDTIVLGPKRESATA